MSAVFRLNLLVSAVFVLAMLLSLYGLVQQGEKDIDREVGSSIRFADRLMSQAQDNEGLRDILMRGEVRHVRFYRSPEAAPPLEDEVPGWFVRLLYSEDTADAYRRVYPQADGGFIYLHAAPEDEIVEVWESALALMSLFLAGALFVNLAIVWGVNQRLKPIAQLLRSLEHKLAGHEPHRDLPQYPLDEANRLARHFDQVMRSLEKEQHSNNQLTRQLMELQEQERKRVAHALHDDLGQYLTGIRAQAFVIAQKSDCPELAAETANKIISHCDEMQTSFRDLIRDLHPVILEQLGLRDALANLANQWQSSSGIPCRLQLAGGLPELGRERTRHLYRLIQEALHNVARHARASEVLLSLQQADDNTLCLRVIDDGCGLKAGSEPGIGMRSMHERARYLGSRLCLASADNGGTCLSLQISLEAS